MFYDSTFCGYSDWYIQEMLWMNRLRHDEFIRSLTQTRQRRRPPEKSIKVLTKAINPVKVRRNIRQPVWRAGRWKSLT